jgi:hypothetical protein
MALTKTLSAAAEERFRASQLGKYATLAHAATANTGFDPTTVYTDRTLIGERGLDVFEADLENLRAADGSEYAIGKLASAFTVYLHHFIANGKELKIVTRSSVVKLTATVAADTAAGNVVASNGSFCKIDFTNEAAAQFAPVDPSLVTPVGYVYSGGVKVGGGVASPDGFHLQYSAGQLAFGPGDASGGDGIGGLTPIVLKQSDLNKVWKYGEKNIYSPDLPSGADVPTAGAPDDPYRPYIVVRSSRQYQGQNKDYLGKTIVAYIPTRDIALVLVQPHKPDDGGNTLDFYRDVLFNLSCEYAVGLDGSDSVLLYEYKTKKLMASPGARKDNYLEVAVVAKV